MTFLTIFNNLFFKVYNYRDYNNITILLTFAVTINEAI